MQRARVLWVVLAFFGTGWPVYGRETAREDLSACSLPHGTVRLPGSSRTPLARKVGGDIFRFSDENMSPMPDSVRDIRTGRGSATEIMRRIRNEGTGDLAYDMANGALVAISGNIEDKGLHFLHEMSGPKPHKPQVSVVVTKGDVKQSIPGAIAGPKLGHCYLLETLDKRLALVRIIGVHSDHVVAQWVFQPDPAKGFEIPKGRLIPPPEPKPKEVRARVDREEVEAAKALTRQTTEKVEAHILARNEFIAHMLALIRNTDMPKEARARAMLALGDVRAEDAVDTLIENIEMYHHYGPQGPARDLRKHLKLKYAAVPALAKIGTPAVAPAITAIEDFRNAPGEKKTLRLMLLRMVLSDALGPKLALGLVEDRLGDVGLDPLAVANLKYVAEELRLLVRARGNEATQ